MGGPVDRGRDLCPQRGSQDSRGQKPGGEVSREREEMPPRKRGPPIVPDSLEQSRGPAWRGRLAAREAEGREGSDLERRV